MHTRRNTPQGGPIGLPRPGTQQSGHLADDNDVLFLLPKKRVIRSNSSSPTQAKRFTTKRNKQVPRRAKSESLVGAQLLFPEGRPTLRYTGANDTGSQGMDMVGYHNSHVTALLRKYFASRRSPHAAQGAIPTS